MKNHGGAEKKRFMVSLLGGLAVLAVCVYGFLLLRDRPALPAVGAGLRITSVDGIPIAAPRDIGYALWKKTIGETAEVTVRDKDGKSETVTLRVVAFYAGTNYPLIYFLIGLGFWSIGFASNILQSHSRKTRIFYWLCLAFSLALVLSGEFYCLRSAWPTFVPCLLFILAYVLAPALFLHFSKVFSGEERFRLVPIYAFPVLLAGFFVTLFLYGLLKPDPAALRLYRSCYFIQMVMMLLYCLAAVRQFVKAYRRPKSEEMRSQVQWILLGLALGMAPFLFLYKLPDVFGRPAILSEEFTALFFIIIPVTLGIAIVRHHLLDIELVINRGLVYSLLTTLTAGIYLLVVQILQRIVSGPERGGGALFSVIGVFAAAAVFHPAQNRIQESVDRIFFRRRYDYRQAVLVFGEQAWRMSLREDLLDYFLGSIGSVLPVQSAGAFVFDSPPDGAPISPIHRGDAFPGESFVGPACVPGPIWVRSDSASAAEGLDFSHEGELAASGLALAAPLAAAPAGLCGWLGLGRKRSGERFTREDLRLIRTMIGELMPSLDRIRLQEEVIYERASREKLDELNTLKTEFVSSVSHELRTPMSSIQGLAELLQSGKIQSPEQREKYLNLMVAESARLSRFLHNVLDFGRIEQQTKRYVFQRIVVQALLGEVVDILGLVLEEAGAKLQVRTPSGPVALQADADALKQALMNLIDNAIKYSTEDKTVEIDLTERDEEIEIRVRDHGSGIAPEEMGKIFERFYRTAEAGRLNPRGAGLGLKIVKHIMDAHRGRIEVESEVGRGSVFRLLFPKP